MSDGLRQALLRTRRVHGHQESWLTTVRQRTRRLVHRHSAYRPAFPSTRSRTRGRCHPLGQTLILTAGCGHAQRWGGPIEEIRPGDVIWFAPGEKHWHGATPTAAMTHIAIQEQLNGKAVDWMEKVSDEEYQAESKAN